MCQNISHSTGFLHHFVLAKLATISIKVKTLHVYIATGKIHLWGYSKSCIILYWPIATGGYSEDLKLCLMLVVYSIFSTVAWPPIGQTYLSSRVCLFTLSGIWSSGLGINNQPWLCQLLMTEARATTWVETMVTWSHTLVITYLAGSSGLKLNRIQSGHVVWWS